MAARICRSAAHGAVRLGGGASRRVPTARRWLSTTRAATPRRVAAVLDIDGVCMLGQQVLPGVPDALQRLYGAGVPTLFATNGGGVVEAEKAANLQHALGTPVGAHQIILCHTPTRQLVERFAGRKVLCVGSPRVVEVAREYGFSHAVGVKDVIRGDPNIYPLHAHRYTDTSPATPPEEAPSFAAVIVFHDPWEWGADLQIALDVLRGGSPLGSGSTQAVPFFHCNPDFVYADRYGVPRLTCGAFTECLRHLFQVSTGHELETTYFGKPEPITFRYAERQLLDIARRLHPDDDTVQTAASEGAPPAHVFDRIFMVGDNPAADIKGANQAGHPWHSVLVRTGVFGGEEANHAEFPAHSVRPSLVEAVDEILSFQQQE